jgi:predicted acyltransferase
VRGHKKGTMPFLVFGMNAIFIYAVSSLLETLVDVLTVTVSGEGGVAATISLKSYLMQTLFAPHFTPYNASLAYAVSVVLVMFLMGYLMWRRKWFVKI